MFTLILIQCFLAGCAATQVPVGSSRLGRSRNSDAALFASVVQGGVRHSKGRIRVDPRPLGSDPSIGPFIRPEQFAQVDRATIDARAAELVRLGIEQFRLRENDRCGSGPGGTPPVIAPGDSATLRDWLSQHALPICVFVSLPRSGGVYYPPAKIDRRGPNHVPDLWTVRVVTIGPGQTTDVLDVVVRGGASRGWEVVEVARLDALRG